MASAATWIEQSTEQFWDFSFRQIYTHVEKAFYSQDKEH